MGNSVNDATRSGLIYKWCQFGLIAVGFNVLQNTRHFCGIPIDFFLSKIFQPTTALSVNMPIEYGIKGQMVNLIAAKRDPEFEKAALRWIYGVLGEAVPEAPVEQVLHDGQVLFRFMQKVRPDLIKGHVNTGPNAAKLRENVGSFIEAITKLGLRQSDLFQTEDLYEAKNIPQVLIALQAVGTCLQSSNPDVPAFGPAPKSK